MLAYSYGHKYDNTRWAWALAIAACLFLFISTYAYVCEYVYMQIVAFNKMGEYKKQNAAVNCKPNVLSIVSEYLVILVQICSYQK